MNRVKVHRVRLSPRVYTAKEDVTMADRIRTHPGEVLKQEFLVPLGMSASALARALGIPTNRVTSIVNGTRSVTADTALRLARYFGTTPKFWVNLQAAHDLSAAAATAGPRSSAPCGRGGKRWREGRGK